MLPFTMAILYSLRRALYSLRLYSLRLYSLRQAILTKAYYTLLTKACAPLLRLLGALASPMASLGVPHVDACGESDGGGPRGDACAELAAELAGLGARLLGLLEEQVA